MIASALATLLLGSQLSLNAANNVPKLDVAPTCRMESSQIETDAQSCMKDEQDARGQLVRQWTQFHNADKDTCVGLTETGGSSSYVELLTCLEMASEARKSPSN
jgi:hypothetical protein